MTEELVIKEVISECEKRGIDPHTAKKVLEIETEVMKEKGIIEDMTSDSLSKVKEKDDIASKEVEN